MNGLRAALSMIVLAGVVAPGARAADYSWKTYAKKPDAWYRSDEAARVAENILSHQTERGDWPKNLDTSAKAFTGDRSKLRGTFDNGATVNELRFLARAYNVTGRDAYRAAAIKALDHILAAQYPSGGWPQSSPPGKGYARHITFNDNTMVNLMELLRDVARSEEFDFVDTARREAAGRAFEAGIGCILRCQIEVDGRLTVWCAQHDEVTLEARGARTYELPSLSGSESAGILLLLMSLDDPGPDVIRAVRAGARWFEEVKITGIRVEKVDGNKAVVPDPDAPPLWARFYEIGTNRPFFCNRDGVKVYSLAEVDPERRNGYAWYGNWGQRVAERFGRWEKQRPERTGR